MFELFQVVDNEGRALKGQGRRAQHFYTDEAVAKGVATQYNNVELCQKGVERQLDGAPFAVKTFVAVEA
jgi:hypothetical protein